MTVGRRRRVAGLAAAGLLVLAPPREARALGPFCAAHPINPLCCPSPCPVFDQTKLGQFIAEAKTIADGVETCRQTVAQYAKIAVAFGPNGPLATELRHLPGNAAAVLDSFRTDLPASVTPGALANPRAVAEMLKDALIDPEALTVNKVSRDVGRLAGQAAAVKDETLNALADAYHAYGALAAAAPDHQAAAGKAGAARDVRGDVAANSAARQGLAESLGGLQEVLASWAAGEATAAIKDGARSLGSLPASSTADKSGLAAQTAEQARRLEQARSLRVEIAAMDGQLAGLVALHNQRHAANLMRAQYPALQNTLESYQAALSFRANDAGAAIAGLAAIFSDGATAFSAAAAELRALDPTAWRDGGKTAAASLAAAAVAGEIAAGPQRFGTPLTDDPDSLHQAAQQLPQDFAAWLEDDKLERYWRPLRDDAAAAIASLDDRSSELIAKFGFDPAGADAPNREAGLLAQFDALRGKVAPAAMTDLPADRRAELEASLQAFSTAADAVRADPAAETFVLVRWAQ